jgi:UDP-glucose 4-epimerase
VVHLAGLKVISDSQERPVEYFDVNVTGTVSLLRAMELHHVKRLVFSSSASVYGSENTMPVSETGVLSPQHPYGQTKCVVEQLLASLARADRMWTIAALRYFNPVGAHESALIGEIVQSRPTNLMPSVVKAALRSIEHVEVFGDDFPTRDGSGVRDFIHVMDLAEGHVAALKYLCRPGVEPYSVVNLGTGRGTSVLQLLDVMGKVAGHPIPHVIRERRSGDVAESYADVTRAEALLQWRATRTIDDMCETALRWGKRSVQGFDG